MAFAIGAAYRPGNGFHMLGAHTDRCQLPAARPQHLPPCCDAGLQCMFLSQRRQQRVTRGHRLFLFWKVPVTLAPPCAEVIAVRATASLPHQATNSMPRARSPCLKLKPVSKGDKPGFQMLAVETYGGGLWHTWFDRDLSVAGRVLLRKGERLVHRLARPQMTWPALSFCCRVVQ